MCEGHTSSESWNIPAAHVPKTYLHDEENRVWRFLEERGKKIKQASVTAANAATAQLPVVVSKQQLGKYSQQQTATALASYLW